MLRIARTTFLLMHILYNDNSFDEVIANDVIASNAPHFENEISSKFLTRSGYENSIQSSLTENQMRLLGEILQMSEKKDFTFACAFDLVKRSELSEEEAQAMYAFVAITSGIVDALQNANPMMTRAMSDGSRRIMCCLEHWSPFGLVGAEPLLLD